MGWDQWEVRQWEYWVKCKLVIHWGRLPFRAHSHRPQGCPVGRDLRNHDRSWHQLSAMILWGLSAWQPSSPSVLECGPHTCGETRWEMWTRWVRWASIPEYQITTAVYPPKLLKRVLKTFQMKTVGFRSESYHQRLCFQKRKPRYSEWLGQVVELRIDRHLGGKYRFSVWNRSRSSPR